MASNFEHAPTVDAAENDRNSMPATPQDHSSAPNASGTAQSELSTQALGGSEGKVSKAELDLLIDDARFEARGGRVANYIPELVQTPEDKTGIAICYIDGSFLFAGDSFRFARDLNGGIARDERQNDDSFTIQSISKVFALLYVLEKVGHQEVFKRMRKEPTGDPFNASPRIRNIGGLRMPDNPLINVGAILTTSMFPDSNIPNQSTCFDLFKSFLEELVGLSGSEALIVDQEVFRSERATGHNNRALAWQMSADGVFRRQDENNLRAGVDELTDEQLKAQRELRVKEVDFVEKVLENYFKQCSILVTCTHLARAAAVLANGGIRPHGFPDSGKRLLSSDNVRTVVALMSSCGMYDGSGQFAHDVGIPGKSGVGGGIMCVVPGRAGIATYAPPLDDQGNSVRGLFMLKELSNRYTLSLFNRPPVPRPFEFYGSAAALEDLTEFVSNHIVPPTEYCKKEDYIPELGAQNALDTGIAIYELTEDGHGNLLQAGSSKVPFTMQSISTLFGFIYALMRQSDSIVFEYIGKEPSGESFSTLKWKERKPGLKPRTPFNAMINAGAILVSAMLPSDYRYSDHLTTLPIVPGAGVETAMSQPRTISGDPDPSYSTNYRTLRLLNIDDFLNFVRKLCGNDEIDVNWQVYESERRTGYKNRSLAWEMNDEGVFDKLMRRHGLTVDSAVIEDILSVYFRLCSIEVTCIDLARAGAVLANQGRDLTDGRHLIPPRQATIAVSLMSSSGLFDGSGEFANAVGIPAKSGVSGGILACVPGRCGIGAFSPVVDEKGNSYRAGKMLEAIAVKERLSIFVG